MPYATPAHGPGQSLDCFPVSPSPCASVAAGILPHATLAHPCASNTVSTPPSAQATLSVTGQLKPTTNKLVRHLRSLTASGKHRNRLAAWPRPVSRPVPVLTFSLPHATRVQPCTSKRQTCSGGPAGPPGITMQPVGYDPPGALAPWWSTLITFSCRRPLPRSAWPSPGLPAGRTDFPSGR